MVAGHYGLFRLEFWLYYIRLRYVSKIDWVILEIKLPREMPKSPQVMEIILSAMHQIRSGVAKDKYLEGMLRAWFSLEIISKEGVIYFYFYIPTYYRRLVESQNIRPLSGSGNTRGGGLHQRIYRRKHRPVQKEWTIHAAEYKLAKEDVYPIKTYIDYKLDKLETEEEMKNDPLASLIELMGTMKEGENLWYQALIRANTTKWQDAGAKIVGKIMKRDKKKKRAK